MFQEKTCVIKIIFYSFLAQAQLILALYTELDVKCDQQSTIMDVDHTCHVGRRHHVLSTPDRPPSLAVYIALADGRRAVAKFLKSTVREKISEGRTFSLFLEISYFSYNNVALVEGNP